MAKIKHTRERIRTQTKKYGKSLTQQQFAQKTNINNIIARYNETGVAPVIDAAAQFLESDAITYHDAMNAIVDADAQFKALPADLRKQFDHDSMNFVEFCMNPENITQMVELGLLPDDYKTTSENTVEPSVVAPTTQAKEGSTSGE